MQVADGGHTMHTYIQTATLLVTFAALGQPKCCSNSLTPSPRPPQDWVATLREATYRSITRHLDYPGGLDGRLDRDHTLWKLLQRATFTPTRSHSDTDSDTGVLVEKLHSGQVAFEFQQMDKSLFECTPGLCDSQNDSVVALWRVRRSDNPYALWIQVKLPKLKDHPTEDVYEYSAKFGLKKLNPDPLQYNSFGYEKTHRFSGPRGKISFRSEERMDIPFAKLFGTGRVTTTSFIYNPQVVSGKSEDGWIISPPRRPHPGVIVDAGIKSGNLGPPYDPHSPFTASGPKGFHHIIHSLPSISPPQNLDHPSNNIRGFLPSVGPVNAPPPYKTEYVYDPRYVLYYKDRPDLTPRFPTQPPKQFKPSTEFVHYSEVDPFYHPNGERDMLSTTPMPFHNFHSTGFPQSINDQLPTNSPVENTRPPFQIIVGDVKPSQRTTTRKPTSVNKPLSTTEVPKNRFFSRPRTKSTERPTTEENKVTIKPFGEKRTKTTERPTTEENKVTIKPFGEKIKPKTSPSIPQTTTRTREKLTTKPFPEINKKNIGTSNNEKRNKVRNNTEPNYFTKPPQNFKTTTNKVETTITSTLKNFATVPTQPVEITENTETTSEPTTEESEGKTTNFNTETMEIFTEKVNDSEHVEKITEDNITTFNTTFTTDITTLEPNPTMSTPKSNLSIQTKKPETEPITEDYYGDEPTEANNETNTDNNKTSEIEDFFSTLTDTLFSMQTTTEKNEETTTIVTTRKTTTDNRDADTQESKQHTYRLVTFPGDTVSIVANRISKSVSYRTAGGKEGQLKTKKHSESRYRFSDAYKDYSTIL